MTNYECMYILKPDLEEEAKNALVAKFSDIVAQNGGEIEKVDEWGKKRLAYPINDLTEGYYTLVKFTSGHEFPRELDRIFNITDGILRSIIIKDGE